MKYLFQNHNNYTIQIPDKAGKTVIFVKGQKIILDEYFRRYVPKYLSVIRTIDNKMEVKSVSLINGNQLNNVKNIVINNAVIKSVIKPVDAVNYNKSSNKNLLAKKIVGKIVGKVGQSGIRATEFSVAKIKEDIIPISNNIGVGILSYNRLKSLAGLITSIRKFTDLTRTTVFVSDESTDPAVWEWLRNQHDIITFHNPRIGIAGNTNRTLRCLDRFKYKLLLNDDVEILANGWDVFYFNKMATTGIKHFCYRQVGVYNASRPPPNHNGIITVNDKPHGAVLALHDDAFKKVGFMDESFGIYGYEHVDYSDRISRAGFAPAGYHDVAGSEKFFKIYDDKTSDEQKGEHFCKAKELYNNIKNDKSRIYIGTSNKTELPSVSYIIPFRDIGRAECIETVVQNVRAQRFPVIQIILSEQDDKEVMNKDKLPSVNYVFSKNPNVNLPFNKSQAFNDGVNLAKYDNLILHDADMLVRGDYTTIIDKLLKEYESVHIGADVCYMTKESTDKIISIYKIDENSVESDRIVSYYEGGSLGIRKGTYIKIGGFCESFVGYGVEDCDFFWKIKNLTKMFNERSISLFHLWHGRTSGWETYHIKNKQIGSNRTSNGINKAAADDSWFLSNKFKLKDSK
jgi:GT2 family glycosyltransferase